MSTSLTKGIQGKERSTINFYLKSTFFYKSSWLYIFSTAHLSVLCPFIHSFVLFFFFLGQFSLFLTLKCTRTSRSHRWICSKRRTLNATSFWKIKCWRKKWNELWFYAESRVVEKFQLTFTKEYIFLHILILSWRGG